MLHMLAATTNLASAPMDIASNLSTFSVLFRQVSTHLDGAKKESPGNHLIQPACTRLDFVIGTLESVRLDYMLGTVLLHAPAATTTRPAPTTTCIGPCQDCARVKGCSCRGCSCFVSPKGSCDCGPGK